MRFAVVGIALLALAACGQQSSSSSTSSSSSSPSAPAATTTQSGPSAEEIQTALAALPAPYNGADYEAGRRVFAQCRSCHTINPDGRNMVGPNLHGVFGREAGSKEGFTYSQALQDANFTWDASHLDHWLANPQTALPGNRMAFAGVRDETQRRDVIAYLMVEAAEQP